MATKSNDILSLLKSICLEFPDNIAVAEGDDTTISYRQLWQQSLQVAEYVTQGCDNSTFVGLNLPKSADYIVSMIGCWMAGKAFVPIGTDLPLARQKFIINHADIKLCINKSTFREAIANHSAPSDIAKPHPHTPAYIIYSSGTTGNPKGILVAHSGLCNLAKCQKKAFNINHLSRYLFFLSVNFDASISDILVTLTSGATLVIEPMPQEDLSSNLFEVVEKRRITHTDIPPALLKMMGPDQCPECLQTIVIGGEPADIDTVRKWSQSLRLINVYGPTEATVCTSMCLCSPLWNEPLIGDPLDNTHYHIYADGRLDAEDGELWISGIGLALAYYKDEHLTQKKFPVVDDIRYYRTSDHVRRNKEGKIVFVGRMDRQVKHHGQLIELEEIEHLLSSNKNVMKAAVVKRNYCQDNSKEAIVAFIELVNNGITETDIERQLRQSCKHHLPRWMMPSLFLFIEKLPLTPSGKTDLQALSSIPLSHSVNTTDYHYQSYEEEFIANIMADILKLHAMAPDDNFFLSGGDSLDTIALISRLQQAGIAVTPSDLRHSATPRSLAKMGKHGSSTCMHSSQLESQWHYPINPNITKSNLCCLLLTGATGFLGSHLLSNLLENGMIVKCLVRCPYRNSGMERIIKTFRHYRLNTELLKNTEIVCGDISLPSLGLTKTDYQKLSNEVTDVIHCAATVNMLASYDMLKAVNVTGTKNILDFCLSGIIKRLHYASTLSVFVSTDRNKGIVYEDDELSIPTNIYGGYGQTKFVAEKMVMSLRGVISNLFIYRFGLLCGDTIGGISAPKDFLGMFFRGAKKVGLLPNDTTDTLAVDVSPINQATLIMADILANGRPGTYHIAAENPLSYNRLAAIMKEEGVVEDIIDYETWLEKARSLSNDPDVQALRMALCRMDPNLYSQMRYMDLFQTTGICFDMKNTHAATNQRCRQDDNLIKLYIKNIFSNFKGRPAAPKSNSLILD